MIPYWRIFLLLAFCASISLGGLAPEAPTCFGADPALGSPAGLEIRVLPDRVYAERIYLLRLDGQPLEDSGGKEKQRQEPAAYYRWRAGGGELLSEGAREVYWKAPAKTSRVEVEVTGLDGRGEAVLPALEKSIEVHAPSFEGMVRIPAGEFVMGDSWIDPENPYFIPTFQNMTDKPPHRVFLDAYWIDRHRVTNRQYAAFLQDLFRQGLLRISREAAIGKHEGVEVPFYFFELPSARSENRLVPALRRALRWENGRFEVHAGWEEHPVVDVTWAGAQAYAFFHGRRLPTEAEWEKAGRGVKDLRPFPWGSAQPSKYHASIGAYAGEEMHPVGHFSPTGDSSFGIADILGRFEWVEDWFGDFYYQDLYSERALHNPRGPKWGLDRVVRGAPPGYGVLDAVSPLSTRYQWIFEFGYIHLFAHDGTGFRTALSAPAGDEMSCGAEERLSDGGDLPLRAEPPIPAPSRYKTGY
jgi:iron(II)-dependent oxidoreductase